MNTYGIAQKQKSLDDVEGSGAETFEKVYILIYAMLCNAEKRVITTIFYNLAG
jgi:hypothetical protein